MMADIPSVHTCKGLNSSTYPIHISKALQQVLKEMRDLKF